MIRNPADGKLKGYNVDYLGAIAAIEEGLQGFFAFHKLFNIHGQTVIKSVPGSSYFDRVDNKPLLFSAQH